MLTSLIIVNAILLKFTDQIIPSISKTFKKQTFTKDQSYDVKSSDVIKQIKTLTPFPVCFFKHDIRLSFCLNYFF